MYNSPVAKDVEFPGIDDFPPIITDVVRDCLQFDPTLRLTTEVIAESPVNY